MDFQNEKELLVTSPLGLPQQLPVLVPDIHRPACLSVDRDAMREPEAVFNLPNVLP